MDVKAGQTGELKARTPGFEALTGHVPVRRRRTKREPVERFDFALGQHLGSTLTVTKQISAGPYTEIYQVWSSRCHCTYACKVLRAGVPTSSDEARGLARESAILRRLEHPNIVRTYDDDPGLALPHILMDYIGGPTLLDRLGASPRRRLQVDDALRVALQVGGAVASLHAKGYLYRDLKPANVLGREGMSVLVDFGTAYKFRAGRTPRVRIGTDPYMAPEQCLGEPLSEATDVWGLGALLYEMLTGEWPYEDRLMSTFDRSRMENRFPQTKFEPGNVRRKAPHVSEELALVVNGCLVRDPEARYQRVDAVVETLSSLLIGSDELVTRAPAA